MPYDSKIHHRRSIRLKDWDYGWPWWYYVTMVINGRGSILGKVVEDEVRLSFLGEVVRGIWSRIPERYKGTELDDCVIMPNHLHGIIIVNDQSVGAIHESPLQRDYSEQSKEECMKQHRSMTLSKIIGWFKMNSAKQINLLKRTSGISVWQRGFYDHIIRNDTDLHRIREYIANNPFRWALDEENPDNLEG